MKEVRSYYDYFSNIKVNLPYVQSGWLSTTGKFVESDWGEHTSVAFDILNEKGWTKDFRNLRSQHEITSSRDFLIKEKGYILLDNPTKNEVSQVIVYNPFYKRTKRQLDSLLKLFNYSENMAMVIMEKFYDKQ